MRTGMLLVGCVVWVHAAAAAPGVVVVPRVDVFEAPSETAAVVFELGRGATICVLDETSDVAAAQAVQGWLAVRLPGRGDVGYVRSETVDLAGVSETVAGPCGRALPATTMDAPSLPQPQARDPELSPQRSPPGVEPLQAPGRVVPLRPVRLSLGIGSGAAWLRKEAASQHRIGDSGPTFHLDVGVTIYDVFSISSSFGAAFPGDNASFTQDVVPLLGGGDPTSAESDLEVQSLSIAVGLRTPFMALGSGELGGPWAAAFADYGSAGIQGRRSIAKCSDCRTDDLDLQNGTFWRVGLDLAPRFRSPKAGWSFTAAYQHYEAGAGFMQEIRIGFTAWLL